MGGLYSFQRAGNRRIPFSIVFHPGGSVDEAESRPPPSTTHRPTSSRLPILDRRTPSPDSPGSFFVPIEIRSKYRAPHMQGRARRVTEAETKTHSLIETEPLSCPCKPATCLSRFFSRPDRNRCCLTADRSHYLSRYLGRWSDVSPVEGQRDNVYCPPPVGWGISVLVADLRLCGGKRKSNARWPRSSLDNQEDRQVHLRWCASAMLSWRQCPCGTPPPCDSPISVAH